MTARVRRLTFFGAMMAAASFTVAEAATFDFADPKGVNSIAFVLDSPLEPIMGVAQGITGTVDFDPENPAATTGSFVFETTAIKTANDRMTEVLHSDRYLDAAVHPTVAFTIDAIDDVHVVGDNVWRGRVSGTLSLHGVTKPVSMLVDVTWLPEAAGKRMRNAEGDLLVLRSTFAISRLDYEISPNTPTMTVGENIEIRLGIVGQSK